MRPVGNQVRGADMGREYRTFSPKLCEVYSPAPRPFLFCDDVNVLESPFYLMERCPPRHCAAVPSVRFDHRSRDGSATLHRIDR